MPCTAPTLKSEVAENGTASGRHDLTACTPKAKAIAIIRDLAVAEL